MNTSSLSQKSGKKSSPAPALRSKIHGKRKQQLCLRNPLQLHELNAIYTRTHSIEAPKGCLSFFLSHSSSSSSSSSSSQAPVSRQKTLHKTPKSDPHVRPSRPSKLKPFKENIPTSLHKENAEDHKSQKSIPLKKQSPCFHGWRSEKIPNIRGREKPGALPSILASKALSTSHSGELKSCGNSLNNTPLSKIAGWSDLDCVIDFVVEEDSKAGDLKTPPVQASVSPEIECGSPMVFPTTPVCYGAGYVVSGVTDKRKCKPRGILTIRENVAGSGEVCALTNFDDEVDKGVKSDKCVSLIPLPMEASVNWVLPTCKEENEDQEANPDYPSRESEIVNGSISLQSPSSSLSYNGIASDLFNCNQALNATYKSRRRSNFQSEVEGFSEPSSCKVSSLEHPSKCQNVILKRGKQSSDLQAESSPFSISSPGSGNVIQTPQSDSNSFSGRQGSLASLSTDINQIRHFHSEQDDFFPMESLTPVQKQSFMDQSESSFQFDSQSTMYNFCDLIDFQKVLNDWTYWPCVPTSEKIPEPGIMVSWRDGLISRIYEMDEFDCCRCLSDEENGFNIGSPPLGNSPSTEITKKKEQVGRKDEENLTNRTSCSCAESICTDGGSLIASGDSDWNLCYKNHLFDV